MITTNPIFKDLLSSVQFLSRLPIPVALADESEPDFTRSSRLFPIAGLIITIPALVAMIVLGIFGVPAMVIAAIVIAIQVIVTGALHEDGLADCADGFGGGQTPEEKLEIMKDSRIGAFGVAALIMALLLRFALLSALISTSLMAGLLAYGAAQIVSRAVQVYFWQNLPSAKPEGLSSAYGEPDEGSVRWALGTGVIAALALTLFTFNVTSIFIAFILVLIAFLAFHMLCQKQINGQTGDTLGAIQILAEIAFLIGLTTFIA